jgi:hypothetical protein
MNRWSMTLLVLVCLAFGSGCGGLKETFTYQSAGTLTKGARNSCKTPLRVAVTPFTDKRIASTDGEAAGSGAVLAGVLVAPATSFEHEHAPGSAPLYVHDDSRLFAETLWTELVSSGCFAEVAFEPLDVTRYDLVFTGTIRRFGTMMRTPFVPIPMYVGSLVATVARSQLALVEVDLFVRRPGNESPILSYGLAGSCSDCSQDRTSDALSRALQAGHAEFMQRLSSYLASRSPTFWAEYQARRSEERRHALDPELRKLERNARVAPAPAKEMLTKLVAVKTQKLDDIFQSEDEAEVLWSSTSMSRIKADLESSNRLAGEVFQDRMRKVILAVVISGASAQLQGSTSNMQRDTKTAHKMIDSFGSAPERANLLDASTRTKLVRVKELVAEAKSKRARALEAYRAATGSVDEALGIAHKLLEPPPEPRATRATKRGRSRRD